MQTSQTNGEHEEINMVTTLLSVKKSHKKVERGGWFWELNTSLQYRNSGKFSVLEFPVMPKSKKINHETFSAHKERNWTQVKFSSSMEKF